MRGLHGCDERVGIGILVCLAEGSKEEGYGEERKRRRPGAQSVCEDLQTGSESEEDSEVEILAEVAVGWGGDEPA